MMGGIAGELSALYSNTELASLLVSLGIRSLVLEHSEIGESDAAFLSIGTDEQLTQSFWRCVHIIREGREASKYPVAFKAMAALIEHLGTTEKKIKLRQAV